MTSIRSIKRPARRAGMLGVHSLDSIGLTVPDLSVAVDFYRALGTDVHEYADRIEISTFGNPHVWGTIREDSRKKLAHLSFGVFEDDRERFAKSLEAQGIRCLDPPSGCESDGIWIRNPDGLPIELRVAEKTSPDEKSTFGTGSCAPGTQGACNRGTAPGTRPNRLAHTLIFASDLDQSIEFYTKVLGMRLSDRAGEGVAFLHGIHGSDHHMIAIAKSAGPGLHHLSWGVNSLDEIGLAARQMAENGYVEGWGLGRHVLGSNYFHYVRDPWGSYSEYSCDIDYIPVDSEWQAETHGAEDAFYLWGPSPPEDFAVNREL
ncbi:VOC family protein [Xanthobacter sp. KR7-225]|uniref:VOC family protein n=1 Tax=Xanthobacter sp. KR7-225 TaxID=3156613 RepID=UPI0032B3E0F0